MERDRLFLYNSLHRRKEAFEPLVEGHVGMYVCGPTVYGDAHIGHARAGVTFDTLYRLLRAVGYKVRYVRNITDVGHLEHDADSGDDKIAKKARLEQLEPMEVAHRYTERYHDMMRALGVLSPSIEPRATGHIIEQIALVQRILDAGFAYEQGGNVYFDIEHYNRKHHYGTLSGREVDDMLSRTRELQGQEDKRSPLDFALWKRAEPEHIMRWPSPWGEGFPGWHLECSAMGRKYLGEQFDIHGGGMDLLFPHHECEMAQSVAATGKEPARFWVHNNMVTIDGQKMGKSLGNFITLQELFSGQHPRLHHGYSPRVVRFFILQAHYRSTLDFSEAAMEASAKGLERLVDIVRRAANLVPSEQGGDPIDVEGFIDRSWGAVLDDMNTPVAIAQLFDFSRQLAAVERGQAHISLEAHRALLSHMARLYQDVLGLPVELSGSAPTEGEAKEHEVLSGVMDLLLSIRQEAKLSKNYRLSDSIRDALGALGVEIQDRKEDASWRIKG